MVNTFCCCLDKMKLQCIFTNFWLPVWNQEPKNYGKQVLCNEEDLCLIPTIVQIIHQSCENHLTKCGLFLLNIPCRYPLCASMSAKDFSDEWPSMLDWFIFQDISYRRKTIHDRKTETRRVSSLVRLSMQYYKVD